MKLYVKFLLNNKKKFLILFTITIIGIYLSLPYLYYENDINEKELESIMISFFVEYPDKELGNLKLIDFPTKLYIAANSLEEFNNIKTKIKNKYVKEIIYWPILNDERGYWLSPFTERNSLLKVIEETSNMTILWDAELPKKKWQILKRLFLFFKNKRSIDELFIKNGGRIYTAEYFPHSKLLDLLRLSFDPNKFNNKKIKMVYSSMHGYSESVIRKELTYGKNKYGDNFIVAFGVLETGKRGNEPKIKSEILERDLAIAKELGINEVVIYRLGGLNSEYLGVIKKMHS